MPADQPPSVTVTMTTEGTIMATISESGEVKIDWTVVEKTAAKTDHDWLWSIAMALLKARGTCQK